MREDKLQSDIVRKFSELYPNKRGQLFHVPNQRNNKVQAFQAKSLGIFAGVADLIFIDYLPGGDTLICALELKTLESRHKVDHIEQQLEWGKTLERCGGFWRLCRTVDEAIAFVAGDYENDTTLSIRDVEKMIKENKNKKTIKF